MTYNYRQLFIPRCTCGDVKWGIDTARSDHEILDEIQSRIFYDRGQ